MDQAINRFPCRPPCSKWDTEVREDHVTPSNASITQVRAWVGLDARSLHNMLKWYQFLPL